MRLALYEPDIPQNAGAIMRLGACMNTPVDIIEPCGFILENKQLRRAAMDYAGFADITRHASWTAFLAFREAAPESGRIVLLTTRAATPYNGFAFRPDDVLLLGRESAGVPDDVHARVDARIVVPMQPGARSLNLVTAAAMVLGEALRQTNSFPVSAGNEDERETP